MKDDPREFWNNVPREVDTEPPANEPDIPRKFTPEGQEPVETEARKFQDEK